MSMEQPDNNMDNPCHEEHLVQIAQDLTQWEVVAFALGLKEDEVEDINRTGTLPVKKINMLRKWKRKYEISNLATYRRLSEGLSRIMRSDLAQKVIELSREPIIDASVSVLAQHLKTFYKDADEKMSRSFLCNLVLPVPKQFFNLVIVEGAIVNRSGESVRTLPMRGKMKEVVVKRNAIELVDVFKDGCENKTILIEGAPGSGKSTLLWYICQKWSLGNLFQEFNYVIYVQLRNPDVQKAECIADLIPCVKKIADGIWDKIKSNDGKGVLFLLDGWDEFPASLRCKSLVCDILTRSPQCGYHFSSVVITSRQNSLCSAVPTSYLEIVGFTEDEAKNCINDLLRGDPKSIPQLLERLEASPSLMGCCYLPLNVVIIANVFLILSQAFPSTMLEILQAMVCNCILRHIKKYFPAENCVRSIKSLDTLPSCVQKSFEDLCRLAFEGFERGQVVFTEEEVGEKCDTLSLLQEAMCFEMAGTSMRYNFLHLTIQELLAAIHMSKMPVEGQVCTFRHYYSQEQFGTVLQFYAGITSFKHPEVKDAFFDMLNSSATDEDKKDLLHGIRNCEASISQSPAEFYKSMEKYPSFGREFVLAANCLYKMKASVPTMERFSRVKCEIDNIPLTPYDCFALGYFIVNVESVLLAYIWNCNLGELCVQYLVKGLMQNPPKNKKVKIGIASNETDENCMKILAELFRYNFALCCNGCNVKANGLKYLVESLLKVSNPIPGMHSLDLQYCSLMLNEENGPLLQKLIESHLGHLDFRGNPGVAAGAGFIGRGIQQSSTLFFLDLRKCHLTSTEVKLIAKGLAVNKSLRQVILRENPSIGDEGAYLIGLALMDNTTLLILDMSLCGLTVYAMMSLTHTLRMSTTVEQLDLLSDGEAVYPKDLALRFTKRIDFLRRRNVPHSHQTQFIYSQFLDFLRQ